MMTAIVQFSLPTPISLEEAARAFEATAPKYQGYEGSYANILAQRGRSPRGRRLSMGNALRRRSRLQR